MRTFSFWERRFAHRFAASGPIGYLILFVLLVAYYAVLSHLRTPTPVVTDEFGNLLIADTFRHGRLTNPTPALDEFFQCIHVLMKPSYTGKYAIGLPILMWLGQALFGKWIVGSWVSVAAGSVAALWALRPVLPFRWRLLAFLLIALHPSVVNWSQNFMGCGLAIFGGAIVLGCVLRLYEPAPSVAKTTGRQRDELRYGLLFGIASVTLCVSRPFEGILLILSVGSVVALSRLRKRLANASALRFLACAAIPFVVFVLFQMRYNAAVTGSAFTLPYMEYTKRYDPVPIFLWQHPRPPFRYDNPLMARQYAFDLDQWNRNAGTSTLTLLKWGYGRDRLFESTKFMTLRPFYRLLFIAAVVGVALVWRRRRLSRSLSLALLVFFVLVHVDNYMANRYTSPAIPLMALFLCIGLRGVIARGIVAFVPSRARRAVMDLSFLVLLLVPVIQTAQFVRQTLPGPVPPGSLRQRPRIEQELASMGRKQLVLIRYTPEHNSGEEWGFNGAEISQQAVVWAHDLGAERNKALLAYYPDREVHLLVVGREDEAPVLSSYSP